MTPRDLIDDLRSRINPAYAAQVGTESWERRLCVEAMEAQADEIERLRAEIDAMRKQESAAYMYEYVSPIDGTTPVWRNTCETWNGQRPRSTRPLYLAPGAQEKQKMSPNDLERLLPCPFCGGGVTEFRDNGQVWQGTKYSAPVSVSVRHWCEEPAGPSRVIERVGRDKEQAIERWNMRAQTAPSVPE